MLISKRLDAAINQVARRAPIPAELRAEMKSLGLLDEDGRLTYEASTAKTLPLTHSHPPVRI